MNQQEGFKRLTVKGEIMADRIYLSDIVNKKRMRVKEKALDIESLKVNIRCVNKRHSFYKALAKEGLSIIGEVKKASPSKGIIKDDFNPLEIAKAYETVVDAISVLTEEDYFLGKDEYLQVISEAVKLPTLCKDFIVTKEQIYHAKQLGASAVLLIVAILSDKELFEFIQTAKKIELDALVEVHTKEEINRALLVGAQIIGINNRNLETFNTDIQTTLDLRPFIPEDRLVISESGIHTKEDIFRLKEANINGILVGESFMRADDIVHHAEVLKNAYKD